MSNPIPQAPKIKERVVWRLVRSLFLHLTLLLILAIYLEVALNSIRGYASDAAPQETELASLDTLPALFSALDTARHAWQKYGDPRDQALYAQIRQNVARDLSLLNTTTVLPSPGETQRRSLARQWLTQIGDPAMKSTRPKPADMAAFDASSSNLLGQFNAVTGQLRTEVETKLNGLKNEESVDSSVLVNMMWIGVGFVSLTTIIFQYYVANSIISPIQSLAGAVRRMQSGDYAARVHLRSGDEIQGLGETFNAMAENIVRNQRELEEKNEVLSAQQEALRHANLGLEERVAEKTSELEDRNQKLNAAARLKDEFLATLSHELRTPLTPVISCAHLLGTDPRLGPDQLKNVRVIDRNARALSRMIDELLDLSAVMNHKLLLARERTEMNEWTRATLETLRPTWAQKEQTLAFIPSDRPVEWDIDPTRLAQVLTNLVNNAIKYTEPHGKITVRLSVTDQELRLAVTDTGTGLDRREIEQIFEIFHQARTHHTQNVGGLGVGLTVARSLAELHGGGLLAESPGHGQGSTFTLWLPRLVETPVIDFPSPERAAPSNADRDLLRGRRVLIVEDSADTREALHRIFLRRECLVTTAETAETALELALHEPPEIIISDLGLPGLSGFELMAQLRSRPEFHNVIAVALSGLGREQDIRHAAEAGFDTHLLKPVDITVLDQTLAQELRKKARL